MGLAQPHGQLFVILAQFGQHIERGDEVRIVVEDVLQSGDVADRAQRGAADFPHALGAVEHGFQLWRMSKKE
jgi:hypothetical protein